MGGTIDPRIALGVQVPQIEGPIQQQQGAWNVQALINAVQLQKQQQATAAIAQQRQQVSLQQEQQDFQDRQVLRDLAPQFAGRDSNGYGTFDLNGLANAAQAKGVNPMMLQQLRMQDLQMREAASKLSTEDFDLHQKQNKAGYEVIESIKPINDPVERQKAYNIGLNKLKGLGVDASSLPLNVPDNKALEGFETQLGMHGQMIADAQTLAKTKQDTAEANLKDAEAQLKQIQVNLAKNSKPGDFDAQIDAITGPGSGASPASNQRAKTMVNAALQRGDIDGAKKVIEGLSSELAAVEKETNPQVLASKIRVAGAEAYARGQADIGLLNQLNKQAQQGGRTVAPGLSPDATDQAATTFHNTGQLPPIGRGQAGVAQRTAIMNRERELFPGTTLSENTAEFKSNAASLKGVQAQADKVDAFEQTAGKNLQVFLNQAQKAIDTGLPIANLPARMVAQKLGSADQTAFETSRQTAINEISRVLNSANATGVVSDSARGEVSQLIRPDATLAQIMSAANILKQDMANRHQAYNDQINVIRGRMGGGPAPATSQAQHVAGGSSQGLKERQTGTGSDGKKYVVKGGVWVPQ